MARSCPKHRRKPDNAVLSSVLEIPCAEIARVRSAFFTGISSAGGTTSPKKNFFSISDFPIRFTLALVVKANFNETKGDFYDDFQELRFKNSGSCSHCAVTATPSDFTCSGGRQGRCRHLYKMGNRRDRSHGSRNTVAACGSRAKYYSHGGLHRRGRPRAFLRGGSLSKGERQQTNYAALANLSSLCG